MKKLISIVLLLAMVLCMTACGEKQGPVAYVTIYGADGLKMGAQAVKLVDTNDDGKIDMTDVLREAHIENAPNKEKDFDAADGGYGMSLTKLWGDNSGGYGYCLNNEAPMNLEVEVAEGDYLCAYVYQDQIAWSDSYSWFDKIHADGDVELTLYANVMDASWNVTKTVIAGATILVDNTPINATTDANGKVKISGLSKGEHTITATHSEYVLNYPVCIVTVK